MTREELNKDITKKLSDEDRNEKRKHLVKALIKALFILIVVSVLFMTYTTYISTSKVVVREYRLINKKIPDSFNGAKIVQLSDLHYGSTILEKELKSIVKMSNERKPDLVLFTGDLIMDDYKVSRKEEEKIIDALKSINASLGKYAVLGNEDNELTTTILNQSDFIVLNNEYDLIYNDKSNPILLVGLNSEKESQDIEKAYSYFKEPTHNTDIYTIGIFHKPDTVDDVLNSYKADLFLAGHSHNGSIRTPITKTSIFKIDGARKYDQDYYHINDSDLYISSGLGTKNGIRLFCRPSFNFFRLSNK